MTPALHTNISCRLFNQSDLIGDVEKRLMLAYPGIWLICMAGNTANLVIYQHRFLRSSTTIKMLTYKAIANMLSMLSIVSIFLKSAPGLSEQPSIIHFYWNSLPYAVFLTNTFASFAIWLTMVISIEQYVLVAFPVKSKSWCTMRNTQIMIGATLTASALLQTMSFVARRVLIIQCLMDQQESAAHYTDSKSQFDSFYSYSVTKKLKQLERVYYHLYSVGTIVLPMIVMTWTTVSINYLLFWSSKRFIHSALEQKRCVTRLSLATMLCHLIFELPHFAVFILAASFSSDVNVWRHWQWLSSVSNFLSLLNGTVPFFVYLSCSRRFRLLALVMLCCRPDAEIVGDDGGAKIADAVPSADALVQRWRCSRNVRSSSAAIEDGTTQSTWSKPSVLSVRRFFGSGADNSSSDNNQSLQKQLSVVDRAEWRWRSLSNQKLHCENNSAKNRSSVKTSLDSKCAPSLLAPLIKSERRSKSQHDQMNEECSTETKQTTKNCVLPTVFTTECLKTDSTLITRGKADLDLMTVPCDNHSNDPLSALLKAKRSSENYEESDYHDGIRSKTSVRCVDGQNKSTDVQRKCSPMTIPLMNEQDYSEESDSRL